MTDGQKLVQIGWWVGMRVFVITSAIIAAKWIGVIVPRLI